MNYATIKKIDVANGTGIRTSLFVSGCTHACKNCFNSEAWSFTYGEKYTKKQEDEIIEYLKMPYIKGLTLLGGEPMHPNNQEEVSKLIKRVRKELPEKDIWIFTGFNFEKDILNKMYKFISFTRDIIENVDVIVDGKYMDEFRNLRQYFRGSENQRIIDVKKSLEKNKVVLLDKYIEDMKWDKIPIDNLYLENIPEEGKKIIQKRKESKAEEAKEETKEEKILDLKLKQNLGKVN